MKTLQTLRGFSIAQQRAAPKCVFTCYGCPEAAHYNKSLDDDTVLNGGGMNDNIAQTKIMLHMCCLESAFGFQCPLHLSISQ